MKRPTTARTEFRGVPETEPDPIPADVARLMAVQVADLRGRVTAAIKAGVLPIPLPKELLTAWDIIKAEFPQLTYGYNPEAPALAEDATEEDRRARRGYWIQVRRDGG